MTDQAEPTSTTTHEDGEHDQHGQHDQHAGHGDTGLTSMAASATLHCLTGCAIGEILGLVLGTALGLHNLGTTAVAIALAFVFGFTLSSIPLVNGGLGVGEALRTVMVADTLSIATMEVVDNVIELTIPGALNAGLVNPIFWGSMALGLTIAYFAALPVNRWQIARGQGHAKTHGKGEGGPSPVVLAGLIAAFVAGAALVSLADRFG